MRNSKKLILAFSMLAIAIAFTLLCLALIAALLLLYRATVRYGRMILRVEVLEEELAEANERPWGPAQPIPGVELRPIGEIDEPPGERTMRFTFVSDGDTRRA